MSVCAQMIVHELLQSAFQTEATPLLLALGGMEGGASLFVISPVNYSTIAWLLHNQKRPPLYIDTLISNDVSIVLNLDTIH